MNEKISIQDIAAALALDKNISQEEAMAFVREIFALIAETLESEHYVKVKGLGTFKLIEVDTRESIHINTKERIKIDGHFKVSFVPDPILRDLVNKPFSHFETVMLNDGTVFDDVYMEEEEEFSDETSEEIEKVPSEIEKPNIVETTEKAFTETPLKNVQMLADSQNHPNDKITKDDSKRDIKERKSNLFYFIFIVVVVVLSISFTLLYIYKPQTVVDLISRPDPVPALPLSTDTLLNEKSAPDLNAAGVENSLVREDSGKVVMDMKKNAPENNLPVIREISDKHPFSDSVNYEIVGIKTTYVLPEGETLTMVAKRFYGTKALWPYIYQYNEKVIKNPDRVPYGTRLRIPELKKK